MSDELTADDLERFARDLGFRRITPAQRRHLVELLSRAVARIGEMRGPARKRQGDAMAEQARWLAAALGTGVEIPERDMVVINRA